VTAHPVEALAAMLVARGVGPALIRRVPALAAHARAWFAEPRPLLLRVLAPSLYQACFVDAPSDDERYAFVRRCLEGSGVDWAEHYDGRSVEDRLARDLPACSAAEAYPVYPFLASVPMGRRALAVQLGCSSGNEAFWLARRRAEADVVGTDVTEAIVARATAKYRAPNLRYLVADALSLPARLRALVEAGDYDALVLFSSGSCQYVLPRHLERMLDGVASLPVPSVVALFEPGAMTTEGPFGLAASAHRGGFSWTHNYAAALRRAGFGVDVARVIHPYPSDSPQHGTVHLFAVGRRLSAMPVAPGVVGAGAPR
jgi:hypothetical protein